MDGITPANGDPVPQLIERCCEAWERRNEAWKEAPGRASHIDVLIDSHTDVEKAAPKTIAGFTAEHVQGYSVQG